MRARTIFPPLRRGETFLTFDPIFRDLTLVWPPSSEAKIFSTPYHLPDPHQGIYERSLRQGVLEKNYKGRCIWCHSCIWSAFSIFIALSVWFPTK
jgi:hypothetical protein